MSEDSSSVARENEEDEEDEIPIIQLTERNPTRSIQLESSLKSKESSSDDEEDEEDVPVESEEHPISPEDNNSSDDEEDEEDVPGETLPYVNPSFASGRARRMKFGEREESSSPETMPHLHYRSQSFASGKNLYRRKPIKRIQSLHSSLKSAFDEYIIQFDDMEGELIRGKSEIKELAKRNKKLEEDLKRAKKGEESSKLNLEEARNKLRGLCKTFAAVKEECDQVYNQQEHPGAVPQLSKKRKYVLELLNCPICFEPWAQSGEHYACSLPCGHFFGRACITQWILRDGSLGSSTCPVCSSRATLSDIRHHFASQIYDGKVKIEHAD